ncbi:SET domain-containing protein [Burkholderia plantarii]|uniref:SET domain-containing protein n=1 Tax=Burkholderia plantarii TaxID=41899 RepID=UPI0018DD87E2|nr:SET domain-containing protein-lysine N-methyltransferase [Burkholderia plantarii]MBI0326790.1 SET domain-containing protein-lysine N-methyltransferase [Burkholderia plantarii]
MSSRRIVVRRSGVHGKGVFAAAPIKAGERVVEYKGERISWKEALRRHPHDPNDPNHTFYFALEEGGVIDGKVDGNSARWINHSCAPNCEAEENAGRVFIHALRDVEAGEELFYDYGLVIDAKLTKQLKRDYACHCGASTCRGTMLAVSGESDRKKKKKDGKGEKAEKAEKADRKDKDGRKKK